MSKSSDYEKSLYFWNKVRQAEYEGYEGLREKLVAETGYSWQQLDKLARQEYNMNGTLQIPNQNNHVRPSVVETSEMPHHIHNEDRKLGVWVENKRPYPIAPEKTDEEIEDAFYGRSNKGIA